MIDLRNNEEFALDCEGEPLPLYKRALLLHMTRYGQDISPACTLVMLCGCTHEEADAAITELRERMAAHGLPAIYTRGDDGDDDGAMLDEPVEGEPIN